MEGENATSLLDEGIVFNKYSGERGGRFLPKMIRLRVMNNPMWKPINVKNFRRLSYAQAVNAGIILFLQVIMYALTDNYKILELSGLGLFCHLVFFSTSSLLTWVVTTKSRSRCLMGATLGFQIASVIVGLILIIFATASLARHGRYDCAGIYDGACKYDPEIAGRIFTSMMVMSAMIATLIALVTSVMLCRLDCCCKSSFGGFENGITFEVEDADD